MATRARRTSTLERTAAYRVACALLDPGMGQHDLLACALQSGGYMTGLRFQDGSLLHYERLPDGTMGWRVKQT